MERIRLTHITDDYFQKAWQLYDSAFPYKERRAIAQQTKILEKENYHFDIFVNKDDLLGFILWWDLDALRFIDHFATATALRNKGLGKQILRKFIGRSKKNIILEVELPSSEINRRRIKFYERLGFILNHHHYEMPPLREGQAPLPLLLMSYPSSISLQELDFLLKKYQQML